MDWLKDLLKKATSVVQAPISFAQQKIQDWAMTHPKQAESVIKFEPIVEKFKPVGKFFEGFGEGFTGGLVDIPLEKSKNLTEKIPYGVGYIGGTLTGLPSKIAKALTPITSPISKPIIEKGLQMAQGTGLKASLGRGLINLAEGIPYTASFTGLSKAKEIMEGKKPSIKETGLDVLGSSATDIGLAALPVVGGVFISTKPVLKQIKNVDELASVVSKEFKIKPGEGLTKQTKDVVSELINKGYRISKDLANKIKKGENLVGKNFVLSFEKPLEQGKQIANFIYEEGYKPAKALFEEAINQTKQKGVKIKTGQTQPFITNQELDKVISLSSSPEEASQKIGQLIQNVYKSFDELYQTQPKTAISQLRKTKEVLNKYVNDSIGASSGSWKSDFYNPDNLKIKEGINKIDEILNNLNLKPKPRINMNENLKIQEEINKINEILNNLNLEPKPRINIDENFKIKEGINKINKILNNLNLEPKVKSIKEVQTNIPEEVKLLPGEVEPLTPKQAVSAFKKTGKAYPFVNVLEEKGEKEAIKLLPKADDLLTTVERKGDMFNIKDIKEDAKDLNEITGGFFTQVRRVIDKLGQKTKEYLVDFHAEQLANAKRWVNDKLIETVDALKKEGIKKGSKEEKILFRLADGKINEQDVIASLGQQKAQNIFRARDTVRRFYDELLERINETRKAYNLDEIQRREDYITHLFEMAKRSKEAINSDVYIGKVIGDAPFFKFGQKRTEAKGYKEDVFDALYKYGLASIYQISLPSVINRYKNVIAALSERGDLPVITNYLTRLTRYIQKGIEPSLAAEKEVPFQKAIIEATDETVKRVSKNLVSSNVSASLSNTTQVLTTLPAQVGWEPVIRGAITTFRRLLNMTPEEIESVFLTNRQEVFDPTKGFLQKAIDKINIFSFMTRLSDRIAFNAYLTHALKQGMGLEEAIRWADDKAARLMGERVYGLMPEFIRKGGLSKVITMFTLEPVNALYTFFKDIPEFSKNALDLSIKLGLFIVYAHAFNTAMEKLTGRRFAFDPVEMVTKTIDIWANKPYTTEEKINETISVLTKNLPLTDVAFGKGGRGIFQTPIFAPIPTVQEIEEKPWYAIAKPALLLANPYGGGYQVLKTMEGLEAYGEGGVKTAKGELKYPVDKDIETFLKLVVFGKSSVPQARRYYEEKRRPLSLTQTKEFEENVPEGEKTRVWEGLSFIRGVKGEVQQLQNKLKEARDKDKSPEEIQKIAQDGFKQLQKNVKYYASEYNQPKTATQRVINFFASLFGIKPKGVELGKINKSRLTLEPPPEGGGIDISGLIEKVRGEGGEGLGRVGGKVGVSLKNISKLKLPQVKGVKIKQEKALLKKYPSLKFAPLKVSTRHKEIARQATAKEKRGVVMRVKRK